MVPHVVVVIVDPMFADASALRVSKDLRSLWNHKAGPGEGGNSGDLVLDELKVTFVEGSHYTERLSVD